MYAPRKKTCGACRERECQSERKLTEHIETERDKERTYRIKETVAVSYTGRVKTYTPYVSTLSTLHTHNIYNALPTPYVSTLSTLQTHNIYNAPFTSYVSTTFFRLYVQTTNTKFKKKNVAGRYMRIDIFDMGWLWLVGSLKL